MYSYLLIQLEILTIIYYIFIKLIIFQDIMPIDLSEDIKTFLLYLRGDDKIKVKPIARSMIS
jgi:hypothetical protein